VNFDELFADLKAMTIFGMQRDLDVVELRVRN
jgi:hypothetical protein